MIPTEPNKKFIKLSEGFRKDVYYCPSNKKTVGYGFCLDNPLPSFIIDNNLWQEGQELTIHVADEWLDYLIDQTAIELQTALPEFNYYEDYIQFVLIDLTYNMGISKLLGFKLMLRAMQDRDNIKTVLEIKDSRYYEQVTNRAKKLINVIEDRNIERAFE